MARAVLLVLWQRVTQREVVPTDAGRSGALTLGIMFFSAPAVAPVTGSGLPTAGRQAVAQASAGCAAPPSEFCNGFFSIDGGLVAEERSDLLSV